MWRSRSVSASGRARRRRVALGRTRVPNRRSSRPRRRAGGARRRGRRRRRPAAAPSWLARCRRRPRARGRRAARVGSRRAAPVGAPRPAACSASSLRERVAAGEQDLGARTIGARGAERQLQCRGARRGLRRPVVGLVEPAGGDRSADQDEPHPAGHGGIGGSIVDRPPPAAPGCSVRDRARRVELGGWQAAMRSERARLERRGQRGAFERGLRRPRGLAAVVVHERRDCTARGAAGADATAGARSPPPPRPRPAPRRGRAAARAPTRARAAARRAAARAAPPHTVSARVTVAHASR